jgi:hypothetical protein
MSRQPAAEGAAASRHPRPYTWPRAPSRRTCSPALDASAAVGFATQEDTVLLLKGALRRTSRPRHQAHREPVNDARAVKGPGWSGPSLLLLVPSSRDGGLTPLLEGSQTFEGLICLMVHGSGGDVGEWLAMGAIMLIVLGALLWLALGVGRVRRHPGDSSAPRPSPSPGEPHDMPPPANDHLMES